MPSVWLAGGCGTLEKVALDSATSLLAGDDAVGTFLADDDPELVADALPFTIKALEALLAANPEDPALNLTTGRLCIQYAHAFLNEQADYVEDEDFAAAEHLRARARGLYRRGRGYVGQGLAAKRPDVPGDLATDFQAMLPAYREDDVPYLFWIGASWAAAIAAQVDNMALVADLPAVEAVMARVLELDPGFDEGAVYEFYVTWEGSRQGMMGGSAERAAEYFEKTLESGGNARVSPYLALAETVMVARQDLDGFRELLSQARAVDLDARPDLRLMNTLGMRRAAWLEQRIPELFFEAEDDDE